MITITYPTTSTAVISKADAYVIQHLYKIGDRLPAIKFLRMRSGLSLKEAKSIGDTIGGSTADYGQL